MTKNFKGLGLAAFGDNPLANAAASLDRLNKLGGIESLASTLNASSALTSVIGASHFADVVKGLNSPLLKGTESLGAPMSGLLKTLDSQQFNSLHSPAFAALKVIDSPMFRVMDTLDSLNSTLSTVMKGFGPLGEPDILRKLGMRSGLFDTFFYPAGLANLIAGITPLFDPDLFREVNERTVEAATELGRRGWTMPLHMTSGQMVEVVENCNDAVETDAAMVAWATGTDRVGGQRRIDVIAEGLLDERAGYGFWMRSLAPAIRLALTDEFPAVVSTLLSVLEGKIAAATGAPRHPVIGPTANHRDSLDEDRLDYAVWASVAVFLAEFLYTYYDFADDEPPEHVNRHGAQHGRQSPDLWTEADAIRLLIALDTVADCIVPWEDNAEPLDGIDDERE